MNRMSSFSRIGAVFAAFALASLVLVDSAQQAEAAELPLTCAMEDHIATSPELHPTEDRDYRYRSVDRGWIECTGTLNGHAIGGRGWWMSYSVSGGGSVAYASGVVHVVGALPIVGGGELEIAGRFFLTRVGLTGWGTGYINGEFSWAQYVATPCNAAAPDACTGPPGTTATVWGTGGTFPEGQVMAPATPTGLTATFDGSDVSLSWEPPAAGVFPVTGYRIYRGYDVADQISADETTFTDPSPGSGTHSYSVVAYNALDVESRQSEPVTVTIENTSPWEPQPSDPFNAPWHLKADTSGEAVSDVELTWKRPRLKDVESYEIYSTHDEFSPIASVERTEYLDPGVDFHCGHSYTYYVAAIAADGTKTWSDPAVVGPFTETDEGC